MTTAPGAAGTRLLWMALVAVALGVGLILALRPAPSSDTSARGGRNQPPAFTRVGQNGPVFTVSVPRARASDEAYLLRVAEHLSAEEIRAGGSGQISVMVWPDDVQVPREPPTTEFDASMKTQAAGIFINPKLDIKHLIRFRDGVTVSERDFGRPTR